MMKYLCYVTAAAVLAAIDEGAFKEYVNSYINPITRALLWLLPLIGGITAGIAVIRWLMKDEIEREQHPLHKPLIKILWAVGIGESISVIFKILGF